MWSATLCLLGPLALPGDLHVDAAAPGPGTGTAADPFPTLTEGLAAAVDGDRVLVAPGRYTENLVVRRQVHVVGTGGAAATLLDGGGVGSVMLLVEPWHLRLTGLTLTGGEAPRGGGLLALAGSLEIEGCVFADNVSRATLTRGGALYVGPGVNAEVRDTLFRGNRSIGEDPYGSGYTEVSGGAVFHSGPLTLRRCRLERNELLDATFAFGASLHSSGPLVLEDTAVFGSRCGDSSLGCRPEALYLTHPASLLRCTIAGNTGPALRTVDIGEAELRDSIVWFNALESGGEALLGTVTLHGCSVQGGWSGPGRDNFGANPLFVDLPAGDLRLRADSPCVDRATGAAVPGRDAAGNARPLDGDLDGELRGDLGAFESTPLTWVGERLAPDLLRVELSGPSNLQGYLVLGTASPGVVLDPLGPLFLDPAGAHLRPLGPLPQARELPVPPGLPPGARLQGIAIDVQPFRGSVTAPLDVR